VLAGIVVSERRTRIGRTSLFLMYASWLLFPGGFLSLTDVV